METKTQFVLSRMLFLTISIVLLPLVTACSNNSKNETFDNNNIDSIPAEYVEEIPLYSNTDNAEADSWSAYSPIESSNQGNSKENDFLVAVTNNPSFRIYDLIRVCGMSESNTSFLAEQTYQQSQWVREQYTPSELHKAYKKLLKAWELFRRCSEVQLNNPEISKYMMEYDMHDIDKPNINDAEDPQLIKNLKVIPLQLP